MTTTFLFEDMPKQSTVSKIEALMSDGRWRHRVQIEREASLATAPQTTLRRLRDLRSRGYDVEKRADDSRPGLFWYRAEKARPHDGPLFHSERSARLPTKQERREAWRVLVKASSGFTGLEREALRTLLEWLDATGE